MPPPPSFTAEFRARMGAELAAAPASDALISYIVAADGYFLQVERLIGLRPPAHGAPR